MTYNFPAGSGGAESFTELADAPAEIVARKMLRGTADGQDLEFVPAPYAREAVDYVDFNFASPSTDTLDLSNNPPYGLDGEDNQNYVGKSILIGSPNGVADSGIWVITAVDETDPAHPMATLARRDDSADGTTFQFGETITSLSTNCAYMCVMYDAAFEQPAKAGVVGVNPFTFEAVGTHAASLPGSFQNSDVFMLARSDGSAGSKTFANLVAQLGTALGSYYAPITSPRWDKISVSAADLASEGGASTTSTLGLPAGSVIHAVKIKHSAAFAGGSLSALTVQVGNVGDPDKYAAPFNLMQAPGADVLAVNNTIGVDTNVYATFTATGDTLDHLTNGAVDVWVLTSLPPA